MTKNYDELSIEELKNELLVDDNVETLYITPDKKFIVLSTKNNAVFCINRRQLSNYNVHAPIKPNLSTGSCISVSEHDYGMDFDTLKECIANCGGARIPYFFTESQIMAVQFLTIEKYVNMHGNILDYKKVK